MKVRLVVVKLSTEIRQSEIPMFRGAVNAVLDRDKSVLFHNHQGEGFRYSYPLIQYKRIGGKAAIVCLGDGAEAIYQFFDRQGVELMVGERRVMCEVEEVVARQLLIQCWNTNFTYSIRKWLPLNAENYSKYVLLDGIAEKINFLESVLVGNILSALKGLGIHLDTKVECKILDISEPMLYKNKDVKLMGFDAKFKSNVSLPNFIGLGKNVSLGYGMIHEIKKTNDNE